MTIIVIIVWTRAYVALTNNGYTLLLTRIYCIIVVCDSISDYWVCSAGVKDEILSTI